MLSKLVFCLKDGDFHVEASMVESWICYAVKHQVQHLTLQPFYPKLGTRFPFYFGGCTSLTTLKLDASHYESRPLPESLELPSLKNLHLIGFERCDGSIFSSFLNLETLKLEDMCFKGIQIFGLCALNLKSFDFVNNPEEPFSRCDFVIVAPKLRKFRFNGYPPFVCSTKNLCSLDLFEIDLPYNFEFELKDVYFTEELKQVFACEVLQMINAFHIAKSITLSMRVIQVLSHIPSLLKERRSLFLNLKSLKVKSDNFFKYVKISSFILDYFLKDYSLLQIVGNSYKGY